MKRILFLSVMLPCLAATLVTLSRSQPPAGFGPGGPGMRGPGGPNRPERKLLKRFDKNGSGWLESDERLLARKSIQSQGDNRDSGPGFRGLGFRGPGGPDFRGPGGPPDRGPGGRGGRGPRGRESQPTKPGRAVSPDEVTTFTSESLYDPNVMRTLFLEFENEDWEIELEDFHGSDVDVPAKLVVDGKTYPNVGVHFRGMSSYGHVSRGSKRSFNVSLDLADEQQRLYGYKTLNLLNGHGDPSMMSTVIYSHIARQYLAAPKANFVHVVVNGKSWGTFVNVQQFDKTFLDQNFGSSKGTRWKVSGNPNADGGLRYLGEDLDEYKDRFEMKSNDGKKAWKSLVQLCKTLNETPLDQLQTALEPILDIDETLKFLALDVALVNSDGYWTRASDYSLFRDGDGKFHVVPHDMNEAFALANHGRGGPGGPPRRGPRGSRGRPDDGRRPDGRSGPERPGFGGPGNRGGPEGRGGPDRRGRPEGPGGPGHGGVDLDPLVGLQNERMPLRSRLLAVPELRKRYLQYVQQIAEKSLDWSELQGVVENYRDQIDPIVKQDTRKLDSYEAFVAATRSDIDPKAGSDQPMSLRKFAEERSKFLMKNRQ